MNLHASLRNTFLAILKLVTKVETSMRPSCTLNGGSLSTTVASMTEAGNTGAGEAGAAKTA